MITQLQSTTGEPRAAATSPPAPRVLICIPTLGGGGAERQVRLLTRPLVERGIDLSLFSRLDEPDTRSIAEAGARCFPLTSTGNHHPRLLLELLQAARSSRSDIIHTFLPQMDVLGGAAALWLGKKWLLSERSSRQNYPRSLKNALRSWLGGRADAIVANSEAGLAVWPGHARRHLIANGIDLEGIRRAPVGPADHRAMLEGRTVILSVARLSVEKRIERILGAIQIVRRTVPDLLMVFMGSGPLEADLKERAIRLDIVDHVHFAGFRTDVWSWLKRASLFVSASSYEGHPNAVLEAAAAGVPQVLSDIPMHRDAVGSAGARFVNGENEDELAAAILVLLSNPDEAAACADEAINAVEKLSIAAAADSLTDLYRALLEIA